MRDKVEKILGYKIPKKLDWVLQRGIVGGYSPEKIAQMIVELKNF